MERVSANHWRLTGEGRVDVGAGVTLFADEIEIFLDTNRVVASGNVVFANPEGQIAAERVEFDMTAGTGTFHQASGIVSLGQTVDRTQFGNQDPDVYFYGDTVEKLGDRRYRITRGGFTTCVQPTPRWEVTSGRVTLNLNEYAYSRNTVLKVKGVPVLYLPALYYPIQDDDRATGLLMPTYGTSTVRGPSISNAFFWVTGRSHDATLFHDWFTRSGQGAGGEFRYLAGAQSSGNVRMYGFSRKETAFNDGGTVTVLPANNSFQVTSTVNQRLGTTLRARAFVDYFSDVVTQQLYQQNLYQATQARRTIEGSLSGVFGITAASVHYARNEIITGPTLSTVYGNTPRVAASMAPQEVFGIPLYASLNTEYAHIPDRQISAGVVTSDRTLRKWDVAPALRLPLSKLTYLSVNTSASYRSTYYSRSLDSVGNLVPVALLRQFLTLRSDFIGPVLTKIWDTPNSESTERMKHVVEPTFTGDYTTEIANQASVPTLNDPSDSVVGGTARFTYGLNNRLFYRGRAVGDARGTTREFMTIGLQQTYYSNREASRVDTSYVSYSRRPNAVDLSPIALTARVSPTTTFDANARLEYDVSGNGLQVLTAGGSVNGPTTSANVSYSRQRPSPAVEASSYLSGSTTLRLMTGRVSGAYALSWDIARAYVVSQTMMASYMAQCCGVQVEMQNFNYPTSTGLPISSDRRINFSIVLAGLGNFSNFFGAFGGGSTGR